jgi:hypothetical protein
VGFITILYSSLKYSHRENMKGLYHLLASPEWENLNILWAAMKKV